MAPAVQAAGSWPQFQHDAAHTGYNPLETTVGPGNVGQLHLLWAAATTNSPVNNGVSVAAGRAFIGTLKGRRLRAFSASTGSSQWKALVDAEAATTPAAGGGRVFISTRNTLYAFAAAGGRLLWSQAVSPFLETSPVLAGGVVYQVGSNHTDAFDAATGTLLWSTVTGATYSTMAVRDGRVFETGEIAGGSRLTAMNAATGAVLWRRTVGEIVTASPVAGASTVFQCSSSGLSAYDVRSGALRWSDPEGCDQDTTPALAQGVVYTAAAHQNPMLRAFSAATGTLLWKVGGAGGRLAVANGVIYAPVVATRTIAAYGTATHTLLWTSPAGDTIFTPPTIAGGILYAGGAQGLVAFGP